MRRSVVIALAMVLVLSAALLSSCKKATPPPPPTLDLSVPHAAGGTSTPTLTATLVPTNAPTPKPTPVLTNTPTPKPTLEISATQIITTASAPGVEGWTLRIDLMAVDFGLHALNCERLAQGLPLADFPKDDQLANELLKDTEQMIMAYVEGKDIDVLAQELGVRYLWSNVFAYDTSIGKTPIGDLLADCSYAEKWKVFNGLDLKEIGNGIVVLSVRRETEDGFERRFLVVWKEE